MEKELNKIYNHLEVEEHKYAKWNKKGYFKPKATGEPFCIILPPPNVTGVLHIGHALDVSIQDVMIRYKKLQNFRTLWIPGTDHAGIATQTKFEAHLKNTQAINKNSLGREEFIKQLHVWKDEQATIIHAQWAKLGLALDYSQEKFTLDQDINQAVNKVFIDLYNNQLIYRGKKLINWDVQLQTAISDIEVIHKNVVTKLYYIKYYTDTKFKKHLVIATSRPETMFGDTCLFVNPNDKRYTKYIGQKVYNPSNNTWIPVLADKYIEIDFGTGVMKCTPAHDFNDYVLSQRHNLELINILNPNGTMNEKCNKFEGLDRIKCRELLVDDLIKNNHIAKIDDQYATSIGYSERTNEIIEPYLSNQWFLKTKPLAKKVLTHQKNKTKDCYTKFMPKRFDKILTNWLNNIEDWCISRQLWWGHQLPVWYHEKTEEIHVGEKAPDNSKNWVRDSDVLDTWFSSGLWPMVALGWHKNSKIYNDFFPTTILVTAYDILMFWVSRMMMLSTYFSEKTPFHAVYIHGLIRDEKGHKMSKSLNNGIEPMQVIDEYGCDTLRLFLTSSSSMGDDLNYSNEKMKLNWSFLNKLWNSARYIFTNLDSKDSSKLKINKNSSEICIWILHRLNKTITAVTKYMDEFNFVISTKYLTDFIWNDFCSVFIELSKSTITNKQYRDEIITTMLYILKCIVIMLHPQCPFITEEIYTKIPDIKESIMKETWPEKILNLPKENKVNMLVEIIKITRKVRLENKIPNAIPLEINLLIKENLNRIEKSINFFNTYLIALNVQIKNVSTISIVGNKITEISKYFTIEIPFKKSDKEEKNKIKAVIAKLESEVLRSTQILENKNFVTKAPKSKIDEEKIKLKNYHDQLESAKASLKHFDK